jgi:hypothetical protein
VHGLGCRGQGWGVEGLGCTAQGLGFDVLVVGVRVPCNGIRDLGLGVRVRVKDSWLVVYV